MMKTRRVARRLLLPLLLTSGGCAGLQRPAPPAQASVAEEDVRPFESGMTRPKLLAEEPLRWEFDPRDPNTFLQPEVQRGSIVARCTITTEGTVKDCALLKDLKALSEPALHLLATRRYTPALSEGRAVAVRYVINVEYNVCAAPPVTGMALYFQPCLSEPGTATAQREAERTTRPAAFLPSAQRTLTSSMPSHF